jgi:hypothetical protein
MLSLPPSVRIFLSREPADMRKGFDTLAQMVREHLGGNPAKFAGRTAGRPIAAPLARKTSGGQTSAGASGARPRRPLAAPETPPPRPLIEAGVSAFRNRRRPHRKGGTSLAGRRLLERLLTQPADRLDELLPHRWQATRG